MTRAGIASTPTLRVLTCCANGFDQYKSEAQSRDFDRDTPLELDAELPRLDGEGAGTTCPRLRPCNESERRGIEKIISPQT